MSHSLVYTETFIQRPAQETCNQVLDLEPVRICPQMASFTWRCFAECFAGFWYSQGSAYIHSDCTIFLYGRTVWRLVRANCAIVAFEHTIDKKRLHLIRRVSSRVVDMRNPQEVPVDKWNLPDKS